MAAAELLVAGMPESTLLQLRPPNSPDLNIVNYSVWGILKEWVYQKQAKDDDKTGKRLIS